MSTVYGPQEAAWDDVQAAHAASWAAVEKSGLGSAESIQAFDLCAATHRSQIRHEARQAGEHEAREVPMAHHRENLPRPPLSAASSGAGIMGAIAQ